MFRGFGLRGSGLRAGTETGGRGFAKLLHFPEP